MNDIEYTPLTQSEQSKLALDRVFIERRIRDRNAHDDLIARRKMERELLDSLYGETK